MINNIPYFFKFKYVYIILWNFICIIFSVKLFDLYIVYCIVVLSNKQLEAVKTHRCIVTILFTF